MKEMIEKASEILRAVNYPLPKYIKVLCVDDDDGDSVLLRLLLNTPGIVNYEVESCLNFETAITKVAEKKHDVYFIDYLLGLRTGIDFVKECTKLGLNGPFVIWSGYNDEKFYSEALENNIVGFIPKKLLSFDSLSNDSSNERYLYSYTIVDNLIRYAIKNYRITQSAREFLDMIERKRKDYNF